MNHNLDELIESSSRILLLQGPVGSFFTDFARWLKKQDKIVYKCNFNAGDDYFYRKSEGNVFYFQDKLVHFSNYLIQLCQHHQIDNIICFGDNRKYHKIAKSVSNRLNINFWVFEEGYFRPDYITFEKKGVNAFSPIPRNAEFFLSYTEKLPEAHVPQPLAKGFLPIAKCATQYYVAANLKAKHYPYYQNHKQFKLSYYIKLWVISGFKRIYYAIHDKSFAKRVQKGEFGNFFIIPLQVYNDSQVQVHADYSSVKDFLCDVLESFAHYSPLDTNLIVKHHPMDRGFIDYSDVIEAFCEKYPHMLNRIFYVHDVPMPVFLRYGKGMVTLNSTSGISALLHNMPVKTLGRANYDFVGLTHQGTLNEFWMKPEPPNPKLFAVYRQYHLNKTQINGSFYNKVLLPYKKQNRKKCGQK
ncbi:capsule biosynthesis protein [Rodentibacter caecimuris]|uniref:Capsule biosynthesis protein n=1 Tax=Rodentibacter caecimuris TaxID=1796644 RepID=A0ABX3KYW7_9PAST|nr:capsule biosynthesis protein [Rodentibacter heylii]